MGYRQSVVREGPRAGSILGGGEVVGGGCGLGRSGGVVGARELQLTHPGCHHTIYLSSAS